MIKTEFDGESAFFVNESAKPNVVLRAKKATKTWLVTSANIVNGEVVALGWTTIDDGDKTLDTDIIDLVIFLLLRLNCQAV